MTYTPPLVAPAAPLPWDLDAMTSRVLGVLRLDPADQDADAVRLATSTGLELVDRYLDFAVVPWATEATIPEPLRWAGTMLGVECFRRKDAPFGRADSWSVDGAAYILSADIYKGVRSVLERYKSREGVA